MKSKILIGSLSLLNYPHIYVANTTDLPLAALLQPPPPPPKKYNTKTLIEVCIRGNCSSKPL